jgi:hypothetical protein
VTAASGLAFWRGFFGFVLVLLVFSGVAGAEIGVSDGVSAGESECSVLEANELPAERMAMVRRIALSFLITETIGVNIMFRFS